ncbi:hypothetical protein HYV80_05990 [Candidatus Woesearchaeota archaeon]|nr:hypothetical protein [Candidatus Woesearchaeota archaeon]
MQELEHIKTKQLTEHIESSILELGEKFINPKYKYAFFATEGSVKCYLYHLIARNKEFLQDLEYTTDEGERIMTWRLHSELATFDKIKSKCGHFDLCITNSDKDFNERAKDNLACIEIEWVSNLEDSYNELKSVLNKLSNPKNEVENGYLIIINDDKGFTARDLAILRRLKEKYDEIKFFIFDAIKHAKYQF